MKFKGLGTYVTLGFLLKTQTSDFNTFSAGNGIDIYTNRNIINLKAGHTVVNSNCHSL